MFFAEGLDLSVDLWDGSEERPQQQLLSPSVSEVVDAAELSESHACCCCCYEFIVVVDVYFIVDDSLPIVGIHFGRVGREHLSGRVRDEDDSVDRPEQLREVAGTGVVDVPDHLRKETQ